VLYSYDIMSATTELLAEELRTLETQIKEATVRGEDTLGLSKRLSELRSELFKANDALNENRQILKG